jgi:hypothetical protein
VHVACAFGLISCYGPSSPFTLVPQETRRYGRAALVYRVRTAKAVGLPARLVHRTEHTRALFCDASVATRTHIAPPNCARTLPVGRAVVRPQLTMCPGFPQPFCAATYARPRVGANGHHTADAISLLGATDRGAELGHISCQRVPSCQLTRYLGAIGHGAETCYLSAMSHSVE